MTGIDSVIVVAIAFFITWISGYYFVPYFKRLKYGQTILDIGPKWHKKKQGIPTMGGVMFILGISLAYISGLLLVKASGGENDPVGKLQTFKSISGMVLAIMLGLMGFLDDFIKVRRKQNEGLTAIQKIFFQVLIISAYFTANYMAGDTATSIRIPFLPDLDLGYLYFPIMGLVIIFIVNAVNLTDGIDGLCSSVTFVYSAVFLVISSSLAFSGFTIISLATAGAMIGFLIWNFNPAKIFMGDTGSMFLGGIVVALGVGTKLEILMIIAGLIYIWEALSVVIQVVYFKVTKGKRLFKMTPIHHSFEMSGWSETKIVAMFSTLALVFGVVAVILSRLV